MGKDNFEHFLEGVEGYHKAIEDEFKITSTDSSTEVRKLIDKKIAAALPSMVDQLVLIANMGDTDNAKLSAIKFAFQYYFKESAGNNDPFSEMLAQLTAVADKAKDAG